MLIIIYVIRVHICRWYKFDDHNVSRMDPNDVPSSAAYILFYATPSKR